MSVVELHPDDLLAKESRARLSSSEMLRLASHLSTCAACRLERATRQDFRAEMQNQDDATPDVAMLINAALGHVTTNPIAPTVEQKREWSPRRTGRLGLIALIAAAILVVVVSAAASWSEAWRAKPKPTEAPACVAAIATAEAKPIVGSRHGRAVGVTDSPSPADSANTADAVDAQNAALAPSAIATSPTLVDAPKTIAPSLNTNTTPREVARPVAVTDPQPAHEPTPVTSTSAQLFADASSARSRGDQARAIALYREVLQRYPASAEASVSRAALGRLLLDLGDLSASLAEYQGYLQRGDGVLAEEAMVGRAEALARMGSPGEKEAWSMVLATYPHSVHAARARARLAALGGQ